MLSRAVFRALGVSVRSRPSAAPLSIPIRALSDGMGGDMGGGDGGSITYSGGQATSGQGGFYGAGGARAHQKAQ